MSLDRKDLRVYFSPEVHAALVAIADLERIEPYKLCERVIEAFVIEKVHAATVLAEHAAVAGLARIRAVSSGSARIEPDAAGLKATHGRR